MCRAGKKEKWQCRGGQSAAEELGDPVKTLELEQNYSRKIIYSRFRFFRVLELQDSERKLCSSEEVPGSVPGEIDGRADPSIRSPDDPVIRCSIAPTTRRVLPMFRRYP